MLPILPLAGLFSRVASMPRMYMLLWAASLALSVVLVVLLRSHWGQSRPLRKCAVLSLLVHMLLAWAAMTVRIIAGDGGTGDPGPSIRVRIVHDPETAVELAAVPEPPIQDEAPPLLEPVEAEPETPPPENTAAVDDSPHEPPPPVEPTRIDPAPDIAMSDAANAIAAPDKTAEVVPPTETPENTTAKSDPTAADDPAPDNADTRSTLAAAEPSPATVQPRQTVATPYSLRTSAGRLELVESQGGNAQTEAAVAAALRWLAAAQSRDGRWDANQFGAGQEQVVLGHNRGGAGRGADSGVSALALLAFLGAGHSHQHGEYQDTVHRGLDFLLRSQAADGSLFGNATLYAQMYCHSMATFALAETQAMTGDRRLEPAVWRAIDFSLRAQNPSTGGWRYRPGDTGDTSQLGWQMMALASARQAGLDVPSPAWMRIEGFLRSVRRGQYGGLASYRPESGPSTSMTAEALYCRLLLAEALGESVDVSAAAEASAQLVANLPDAERLNLYYWYYATLALHHAQQQNDRSADDWRTWNAALTQALLATQVTDGGNAGSWHTNTVWGGYGGRVYTTAMAAMCLEAYYRYTPPAARDRWTATRPPPPSGLR